MKITGMYTYCSSCFSQKIDVRHVDLEAYFDGPTLKQDNGDYVAIDDLILCENCIKEAAALVGMYPSEHLKRENLELGSILDEKNIQIEKLHELITDLQHSYKTISDEKILKPQRRPKVVSLDESAEELKGPELSDSIKKQINKIKSDASGNPEPEIVEV